MLAKFNNDFFGYQLITDLNPVSGDPAYIINNGDHSEIIVPLIGYTADEITLETVGNNLKLIAVASDDKSVLVKNGFKKAKLSVIYKITGYEVSESILETGVLRIILNDVREKGKKTIPIREAK